MHLLRGAVQAMDEVLRTLTHEEERRLERSLARLSSEQIVFVRDTLQRARRERCLPVQELNLLEYCFEKWWAHSLATKMAILDRIAGLSGSPTWLTIWTDHEAGESSAREVLKRLRSVSAPGPQVARPATAAEGAPSREGPSVNSRALSR